MALGNRLLVLMSVASWSVLGALQQAPDLNLVEEVPESLQLLQVGFQARPGAEVPLGGNRSDASQAGGSLFFVHSPCTFGHTVEDVALGAKNLGNVVASFAASAMGDMRLSQKLIEKAKQPGGAVWGMMYPESRAISSVTNCNLYYTPAKYWPADILKREREGKKGFAVLRDPYDRMANEFRMQVMNVDSAFMGVTRYAVSKREGNMEREGPEYQRFYKQCDVNGYLKAELQKVMAGDRYRDNCHLLPQADFFDGEYGASLAVDNRKIPQSFNDFMQANGYPAIKMGDTLHNTFCNNVSAYSLNDEVKKLIKEVYSRDFDLLCRHFGYCDREELTCLEQIPQMCGGKPGSTPEAAAQSLQKKGSPNGRR